MIDETRVEDLLPRVDLVALMRETLAAAGAGDAGGPVRSVLATGDEMWFATMPAFTDLPQHALGAKLVVAIPRNAPRGLPTHRAVVILIDPDDGAPVAWIDGEAITRERTAAVSVVATQALAASPRGRHAILGAGVQGRAHCDAFARAGLLDTLVVWSRDRARAESLAAHARDAGIDAVTAVTADEAVRGAHVVSTCTNASAPLFEAASVGDGAHVNAVGACVPERRELPGTLVGGATVVVDDLAAARRESGDVLLAVAEGAATWDGIVGLDTVLASRARPRPGRASVFVSLGLGVEDVATAAALFALVGKEGTSS